MGYMVTILRQKKNPPMGLKLRKCYRTYGYAYMENKMFKEKSFVIIGSIKDGMEMSRKEVVEKIKQEGGKYLSGISNQTSYIIFPNKITERERNNKQIKKLSELYNKNMKFLKCEWLKKCFDENKIIPTDEYILKEFYDLMLKTVPIKKNKLQMCTEPNYYDNFLNKDVKCWMGFIENEQETESGPFYYNTLLGLTTYTPCEDYKTRLFGDKDIIDNGYYDEDSQKKRFDDIVATSEKIESTLKYTQSYLETLENLISKKRKRDDFTDDKTIKKIKIL